MINIVKTELDIRKLTEDEKVELIKKLINDRKKLKKDRKKLKKTIVKLNKELEEIHDVLWKCD